MAHKSIVKVKSPGRICLFGEHQDYLGLPVIAAAINRYIEFEAELNQSNVFRFEMPDIKATREIQLVDPLDILQSRDYLASVIRVLRKEGLEFNTGCRIKFSGNIPLKSGASSSSAMVVGLIKTFIRLYSFTKVLSDSEVANLAFQAEVIEHGEMGGMMDHYSISIGDIIHLDTVTYENQVLGNQMEGLILGNSLLPKEILEVHGRIKPTIMQAIDILTKVDEDFRISEVGVDKIADYYDHLPIDLIPIFYATVTNHSFTQLALETLKQDHIDYQKIGSIMNQHHERLRDYLQITVPKINLMINIALEEGALGAKINGSGGGGTIAILAPGCEDRVCRALETIGAEAYPVTVDPGVRYI
ncbi:MAG: galactokinase [Candidatus Marinimicrobia bacterium]|nr:galactokinase [Candidatus Neomarinimicrobiota bacterium]MCF7923001.1 galactokinase [Candidatus Neomarinimicrobiota bacterium]